MTSVMTGFSLATTTVEAQAIHTDTKGLVAGALQIPVADGQLPGYAARPDGAGPFPTILVIEEVFGVNEYIQDVCRRFAKVGYLAVAPENLCAHRRSFEDHQRRRDRARDRAIPQLADHERPGFHRRLGDAASRRPGAARRGWVLSRRPAMSGSMPRTTRT